MVGYSLLNIGRSLLLSLGVGSFLRLFSLEEELDEVEMCAYGVCLHLMCAGISELHKNERALTFNDGWLFY